MIKLSFGHWLAHDNHASEGCLYLASEIRTMAVPSRMPEGSLSHLCLCALPDTYVDDDICVTSYLLLLYVGCVEQAAALNWQSWR